MELVGTSAMKQSLDDIYAGHSEQHLKGKGDNSAFRTGLEQIRSEIPYSEVLIITTLPRGSLQIAQPPNVSEGLLKGYGREFHAEDRLTWRVMIGSKAMRLSDAWEGEDLASASFFKDFLQPEGLIYGIAGRLAGPILDGYPGAIHLYRSADLGDFSEADLDALERRARELDDAIQKMRVSRASPQCNIVLPHASPVRQFVFNDHLQPQVWANALTFLDVRLREGMLNDAQQRLAHLNGKAVASDRVPLADSRGDLWNFRVIVHRRYPALGEGAFVFFCQQPECKQWGKIRSVDFQADTELARLVPALRFMQEHFSKSPTLVNIAKAVHLSPFHFHRRFTELLGITPKHFLLDCQIEEAKRQLVAREKSLPDIAAACGFAHQSHFTSRFKQATGLTPTRWRRLATESQQISPN